MTHAIGASQPGPVMADKAAHSSTSSALRRGQHANAVNREAKADDEKSSLKDGDARRSRAGEAPKTSATEISDVLASRESRTPTKSDAADDDFAATIDGLEGKPETPAEVRTEPAKGTESTVWNANAAFAQIALARLSDGEAGEVSAAEGKDHGNTRRSEGLKTGLPDLAEKRVANHLDMPTDELPEETLTTTVRVDARETHWLFSERKIAEAGTAAANGERTATGKIAPQEVLSAKAQDLLQKASNQSDKSAAQTIGQAAATSDAPKRQTFDSQRDNGKSREQTGSDRRPSALGAAGKTERVATDMPTQSAGVPAATQQLKNGILNALTGGPRDGAPTQTSPFHTMPERPTMAGQVLRAIDITLSPPDLGTVKVRMSLRENALEIDAAASKASTAKLLHDDRKGLEQSLRESGYDVSSLKISEASTSSSANFNSGTNPQDGGQARTGFLGQQASDQQRREGAPSDQSQQRSSGERSNSGRNESDARQTSGIYI
ncbi:hypothetical protein DLM45_06850 [Hyphomicrobium methylovorum]|uniref:flagellar hook-length control protein FliK n=1 Tax=Hyphomicrobium methylovorum TaxID=84 RepID=UPI0015E71BC9|nr:flagellar hook-length control protein FliK [Hyphomicrobium methylovorum]MBA2125942.1 hypothetical protein [Hyphomicrobium methylovorum]